MKEVDLVTVLAKDLLVGLSVLEERKKDVLWAVGKDEAIYKAMLQKHDSTNSLVLQHAKNLADEIVR